MLLELIAKQVSLETPQMIAFIGGGGKTSSMIRLGKQLNQSGKNVLISTTTKMYAIEDSFVSHTVIRETLDQAFEFGKGITLIGKEIKADKKLIGHPPQAMDELHKYSKTHWLLVEADGSRGLSLKAHRLDEPQMPETVNLVIALVGADIYGQVIDAQNLHRPELFCQLTGAQMGDRVTAAHVIKILTHPEGYFKNTLKTAKRVVWVNKARQEDEVWIESVRAALPCSLEVIPWGELLQP